jgi:2-oxoisovalerate dehydrogenase E1 component alpha subunit
LGAHSTSDDWKKYRSTDEVEVWRKKDPLLRLRLYLESRSLWSEGEEVKLRKLLELTVNEGISKEEKISPPRVETMFEDVYSKLPASLDEQKEDALAH